MIQCKRELKAVLLSIEKKLKNDTHVWNFNAEL